MPYTQCPALTRMFFWVPSSRVTVPGTPWEQTERLYSSGMVSGNEAVISL